MFTSKMLRIYGIHVRRFFDMKTVCLLISLLLSACASIQRENVGKVISNAGDSSKAISPIVISASLIDELSSEYFGYFDFTIENSSEKWLTVKFLDVEFGNGSQGENIKFMTGEPLENWKTAMATINQLNRFNKATTAALIGGVGLGLAATSSNQTLQSIGGAAVAGSAAYLVGQEVGANLDFIKRAKMAQTNNLLQDSTLVLPGLFVKKWLLVNSGKHDQIGYLSKMAIRYTINGSEEKIEIEFRKPNSPFHSNWQAKTKSTLPKSYLLSPDNQKR